MLRPNERSEYKKTKKTKMQIFQRKTPRASWIEYNEGMYFITICTRDKKHYFGMIQNEEMQLSEIGKILLKELNGISSHYPYIEILQFVIMPNHLHLLVDVIDSESDNIVDSAQIVRSGDRQDAARCVPTLEERFAKDLRVRRLPKLSVFVRGLKSAVSKQVHQIDRDFAWQPRYHDHAIRNVKDMNNISNYIENNVLTWYYDCFNR